MIPDPVSLIVWLIAGAAGGNAAGDFLLGGFDLGPANTVAGAVGGAVGAEILQIAIPAMSGFDLPAVVGQIIAAAVGGALLTVVAGAVKTGRRRGRQ